ncbi:chemotaxis protein CheW [Jeotgalibacillus sp. ET6]|uniref:chemotaxis protein CheW n=1 Tax=Jeotgalibacillus sp. ET6 TaxID=3037260 RepID=UPI002418B608|nr:chemotaxis protein CheW [Jeotgalibacillus sp. ET6]MDG5470311.1 chemotaxis protein CheW [Jeotgalibacillus sp. ET6]
MVTEAAMLDIKVIVFKLMDKEYAIPVENVRSIEKVLHITRVPKVSSYIKGVINLRGVVTPIIDLRERFSLAESKYDVHTRIIIVKLDQKEVGLIVDSANDVLDVPLSSIEPQPAVTGSVEADFINGVAKLDRRLLIMLKMEVVLDNNQ